MIINPAIIFPKVFIAAKPIIVPPIIVNNAVIIPTDSANCITTAVKIIKNNSNINIKR